MKAKIVMTPKGYGYALRATGKWMVKTILNIHGERVTEQYDSREDARSGAEKKYGKLTWIS